MFEAIRNLEAAAKPIDVVTLENEVEKKGKLEAIGGIGFLGELALRVPTVDNIIAYTEIVKDHSQARKLILAASEISEKGYEDDLEIRDYLDDAEAKIFEVTQRKDKAGPEPRRLCGATAKGLSGAELGSFFKVLVGEGADDQAEVDRFIAQ